MQFLKEKSWLKVRELASDDYDHGKLICFM